MNFVVIYRVALCSVVLLASACAPKPTPLTSQLRETLSHVSLETPIVDLDRYLALGDKRFVCVRGYTSIAPGVDDASDLTERYGMRCLDGTSDGIESAEHEKLMASAYRYARIYNAELIRRIRLGIVP
jgi:hypothetical protein